MFIYDEQTSIQVPAMAVECKGYQLSDRARNLIRLLPHEGYEINHMPAGTDVLSVFEVSLSRTTVHCGKTQSGPVSRIPT